MKVCILVLISLAYSGLIHGQIDNSIIGLQKGKTLVMPINEQSTSQLSQTVCDPSFEENRKNLENSFQAKISNTGHKYFGGRLIINIKENIQQGVQELSISDSLGNTILEAPLDIIKKDAILGNLEDILEDLNLTDFDIDKVLPQLENLLQEHLKETASKLDEKRPIAY
ncbi:MAG: hypothetical protein ACPF8V_10785, partial [Luteibaculum sp.]